MPPHRPFLAHCELRTHARGAALTSTPGLEREAEAHSYLTWIGPPIAPTAFLMLDGLSSRIERYMDLLSARQKLVARNIANAETPGYKTQDVDFQAELRRVSGSSGAPAVIETAGLETKNDGNNVSLDREARMLAENAIRFNIAAQLLRTQIRQLKEAINEGRNQ